MKTRAMLWAGLLAIGALSASAQPMPPEPRAQALTESQERELLDFVKTSEPNMYEHLNMAKEHDPQLYHHKLSELWNMYEDPEAREQFAKTMKSNRAVRELVEQYKKAEGADKAALKESVTKAVAEMFDLDVQGKELQIKKMQAEISKLKDKIARRRQLKDKFVAKRVEQLTGEGEDWGW